MYTAKQLIQFTHHLKVLYVEDDDILREETLALFQLFFKEIDTACDGVEGLQKYNDNFYDLVVTDINMPNMNGIEMISHIKEINPEQKILAISAHNESDILIKLIKAGVSSFILKPILQAEVINTLYPVSRDAYTQILNIELVNTLNKKGEDLEKKIKELQARNNTIDTKHSQIQTLLQEKASSNKKESLMPEYFDKDEDEGDENVVFIQDDADDLLEYFRTVPERLSFAIAYSCEKEITGVADLLSKTSSILLRYTPYLDTLASSLHELSEALKAHTTEFIDLLSQDSEGVLKLFDAVSSDMERYIERFSVESMAMKNAHHIHEPTMLSIRQIITLFIPHQIEEGEIEFF